jgi:hypothetical protein
MSSKWRGLDRPISQVDAEREPPAQRLSFERRPPSWATRQALLRAEQHAPLLPASDLALVRARQRPRRAS